MIEKIGHRIFQNLSKLASYGNRWMGSVGEKNAREFIAKALSDAGLGVDFQTFPYLAFDKSSALFSFNGCDMACEPLAYSASTDDSLTAPLLYVGNATPADFARLAKSGYDISKSIVLSDNLRSFTAYPQAEAAGALGFVLATNLPGNTIRCGSVRFDRTPGKIPGLAIGGNDSREIINALKEGLTLNASLSIKGRIESRTGINIIGKPYTKKETVSRIVLSAHYDSFWNGVHAMDNLAGVATLLELACTLPDQVDTNLEFVFFAGEELGSWGAAGYVGQPDFDPKQIRSLINLDAFGSKISDLEVGVTEDLIDLCRKAADDLGIRVDCWNTPPREASDHKEFLPYGIPSVWLANNGTDKTYHTPLDCVEGISTEKLFIAFDLASEIVRSVSRIKVLSKRIDG